MEAPSSHFYITGGTLRANAPSYVERQADHDLLAGLLRGEFCYVLTSRQMGKSSLMVRTAAKLRDQGVQVAVLDLTAIGQNLTPDQWYDGLMVRLGRQWDLEEPLEDHWLDHQRLSPVQRFFTGLQDVVLAKLPGPVVIFVDEIDTVRSLPFPTDEFFAAIRECYNRRTAEPVFQRLTFCLLGVATPSDLIVDTRMTPFNIGQRVDLKDFSQDEAMGLARGLAQNGEANPATWRQERRAESILKRVYLWTHGHPYLTQRLCHFIAQNLEPALSAPRTPSRPHHRPRRQSAPRAVDRLCQDLFLSSQARERDDNLLFVRERILRGETAVADLLTLYGKILRKGSRVADDETNRLASVLRLSGIIRVDHGQLRVRNRIYRQAFDTEWIEHHMPDADLRRQREAYRKGLIRAASVSAGIILVMLTLVAFIFWKNHELKKAIAQAFTTQAQAARLSGKTGQRFEASDLIARAAALHASRELVDEAAACLALPDLRAHTHGAVRVADATAFCFSPAFQFYARGEPDGAVAVFRAENHERIQQWTHFTAPAERLVFSRNESALVSIHPLSETSRACAVWNLSNPELVRTWTNDFHAEAVDIDSQGTRLGIGTKDGRVHLIALDDATEPSFHRPLSPFGRARAECAIVKFHPREPLIAVAGTPTFAIHALSTDPDVATNIWLHSPAAPTDLAWHPHAKQLAVVTDRQIRLWDLANPTDPLAESEPATSVITRLAYNQTGTMIAAAGMGGVLGLWDPYRNRFAVTHTGPVAFPELRFGPGDRALSYERAGPDARLWEVKFPAECVPLYEQPGAQINSLAVHPDGRWLMVAHNTGWTLWDLHRGSQLTAVTFGETYHVAHAPRSDLFLVGEYQGPSWISLSSKLSGATHQLNISYQRQLDMPPTDKVLDVVADTHALLVVSPSGISLLNASGDSTQFHIPLEQAPAEVACSPDGQWIAASLVEHGETVRVWNTRLEGVQTNLIVGGRARLQFSPDGATLATGTDKRCQLWQVGSWRPLFSIPCKQSANRPSPVTFSQDGRYLAVAVENDRIQVRDCVETNRFVHLKCPYEGNLNHLRFSPDTSRLACAFETECVQVWNMALLRDSMRTMGLSRYFPDLDTAKPGSDAPVEVGVDTSLRKPIDQTGPLNEDRRLQNLRAAARDNPTGLNYRSLAVYLKDRGEWVEAAENYRRCLELTPKDDWALRDLAWIHLFGPIELRDIETAEALARKAIVSLELNFDNQFCCAVACYRAGNYESALRRLERALQIGPDNTKELIMARFFIAMCQSKLGFTEPARSEFAEAIQALGRLGASDTSGPGDRDILVGLHAEAKNLIDP